MIQNVWLVKDELQNDEIDCWIIIITGCRTTKEVGEWLRRLHNDKGVVRVFQLQSQIKWAYLTDGKLSRDVRFIGSVYNQFLCRSRKPNMLLWSNSLETIAQRGWIFDQLLLKQWGQRKGLGPDWHLSNVSWVNIESAT